MQDYKGHAEERRWIKVIFIVKKKKHATAYQNLQSFCVSNKNDFL